MHFASPPDEKCELATGRYDLAGACPAQIQRSSSPLGGDGPAGLPVPAGSLEDALHGFQRVAAVLQGQVDAGSAFLRLVDGDDHLGAP
jgi:hypothetical protein